MGAGVEVALRVGAAVGCRVAFVAAEAVAKGVGHTAGVATAITRGLGGVVGLISASDLAPNSTGLSGVEPEEQPESSSAPIRRVTPRLTTVCRAETEPTVDIKQPPIKVGPGNPRNVILTTDRVGIGDRTVFHSQVVGPLPSPAVQLYNTAHFPRRTSRSLPCTTAGWLPRRGRPVTSGRPAWWGRARERADGRSCARAGRAALHSQRRSEYPRGKQTVRWGCRPRWPSGE